MVRRRLRPAFVTIVSVVAGCADQPAPRPPPRSTQESSPQERAPASTSTVEKRLADPAADPDKDGVATYRDECPLDPEDADRIEDDDGCPEVDPPPRGPVVIGGHENPVAPVIRFREGRTQPTEASMPDIEWVARTLDEHPEVRLLRIEGHDDGAAGRAAALQLSTARAKAVELILVTKHKIAPERLRAVGVGAFCPWESGATAEGRSVNRRVELRVEETSAGPTGVEIGCAAARDAGLVEPKALAEKP